MNRSERNFRNYPKDIHKLNTLQKAVKHAGKRHISTNPQDSSLQSSSSLNSLQSKKMKESPVEIGGNVEKRQACGRQVFSTEEVAEGMVLTLKSIGIGAGVARCSQCRLIHVNEYSKVGV